MNAIDRAGEQFRSLFADFYMKCEELNTREEAWNELENGKMTAFYENIFLSLILRLIVKDGVVKEEEIEYLNKCFDEFKGFFDTHTLQTIYNNSTELLFDAFITWLMDGKNLLLYETMRKDYIELIRLACVIIINSDEMVTKEEREEITMVMARLA